MISVCRHLDKLTVPGVRRTGCLFRRVLPKRLQEPHRTILRAANR